jgi:hypothetical protein
MHDTQFTERGYSGNTHSISPSRSFSALRITLLVVLLIVVRIAPPNLPAKAEVVIDDPDPDATLRRTSGGGHARWPSPNDKNVEMMSRFAHHLFSLLGIYFHALFAQHLTAPAMQLSVDSYATFKANSHAT